MIKELVGGIFNLFSWFFNSIEPSAFSLESYLLLHFTILGIVVTLVALTTNLTKEVRQDLIKKYYLKTPFVIIYYCTILVSFILTLIVYIFNKPNFSNVLFILSIIVFFYTAFFIPKFLFSLNREGLYKKILKEFKYEIEKRKENCQ